MANKETYGDWEVIEKPLSVGDQYGDWQIIDKPKEPGNWGNIHVPEKGYYKKRPVSSNLKGWEGVREHAIEGLLDAPTVFAQMLESLPSEFGGAGNQFITKKMRAAKNIASGLGEGLQGLWNLPSHTGGYLGKQEIINPKIGKFLEKARTNIDFRDLVGLEGEEAGDKLLSMLGSFTPAARIAGLHRAAGLSRYPRVAAAGAIHSAGQGENPITGAVVAPAAEFAARRVGTAARTGRDIFNARTATSARNTLIEAGEQNLANNQQLFRNIHGEAAEHGIRTRIPEINFEDLVTGASRKERGTIANYMENPDIRNTQNFRQDVGKLIGDLTNRERKSGLLTEDRNRLAAAQETYGLLTDSMLRGFEDYGRPDLSNRFLEANRDYMQNVLPYENPVIQEHLYGGSAGGQGTTNADFVKALARNPLFKQELAPRHGEIVWRNRMTPSLEKVGSLGGMGWLGSKLFGL